MKIPELGGSSKQVAWATDLRNKEIDGLICGLLRWAPIGKNSARRAIAESGDLEVLADSLEEETGPDHPTVMLIRQFVETIKRETHSRYWIDTRIPK